MTSSLVPSSSASHGITLSQNVARDVAERIEHLRRGTGRTRALAWSFFLVPLVPTLGLAFTELWPLALFTGYFGVCFGPIGWGLHVYRRRELKAALRLDRNRDVTWVSRASGLVFFGDDGVFIEKRGGFKPYRVPNRGFTHVHVDNGVLTMHGRDTLSGTMYALEVDVPRGWTDDDTARIQAKL